MSWWQLLILWLCGWATIILLNILNRAWRSANYVTEQVEKSLVVDGNNLFLTGLVYFIGNIICIFVNFEILHWVLMILGIVGCVLPFIISIFGIFKYAVFWKGKLWLTVLSALICDIILLTMALNIYFAYIK